MTEAFASAVAVTVPILALAAGAEVRAVRERVRQPDEEWEKAFAAYAETRELDLDKQSHADAVRYFMDLPAVPKAFIVRRLMAIVGAFLWLVVFVLLTVDELLVFTWLGDGARGADTGLAVFSVVTTGIALAAVVVSPALYLLVPLLMPLDLMPHGLRVKVGSKVTTVGFRDFLKHLAAQFEGAVDDAVQEAKEAKEAGAEGHPPPEEA
jgi:hypothetical protein